MADAVMRYPPSSGNGMQRVLGALLLLLSIAFGARVIWGLLAPVVPELVVAVALLVVYRVIIGRRGRW